MARPRSIRPDSLNVVRTVRDSQHRLARLPSRPFGPRTTNALPVVRVTRQVEYQTIQGFGGAFTEAAAHTFFQLPPKKRQEVIAAYFDAASGQGYTVCRTHINSCDFALGNYAYDEVEGDVTLKHFSIDHDRAELIPLIKLASKKAGGKLLLFASPWSPPAWMKTNGKMNLGGQLKPECRDAWARYICKYVKEYAKAGVDLWGLTVQNEPAASQSWDSCVYSAAEERDFVRDHLGPALHRQGLGRLKLMIWDHNRDLLFERARVTLEDPAAAKYVWGTAFHWYGPDCFHNVQAVHDAFPDKHLLFSEGCQEGGPHTGEWMLGERYARSIINDLNRWTEAWVDWNILLNSSGGPNHVKNMCSAPILADTSSGQLLYQSSYYYIGHFSRYIRPGAKRVLSTSTNESLETVAAVNADGSVAAVVLNRGEQAIEYVLADGDREATVASPPRSITTLIYAA